MPASQIASLRVSAASPIANPRPSSRGSRQAVAPRRRRAVARRIRAISRHADEHEQREERGRVGQRAVEQQRQLDGRGEAGADGEDARPRQRQPALHATSSASRQARIGMSAPATTDTDLRRPR